MKTLLKTLIVAAPVAAFLAFPSAALGLPAPLVDDHDHDEEAEEEEEDADRWFAITNADVYTGTGAVLRGATVLSKNGVIEEIGHDLYLPEETEILDAMGMRVYPGLVAMAATTTVTQARGFNANGDWIEKDYNAYPDPHFGIDEIATKNEGRSYGPDGRTEQTPSHIHEDDESPVFRIEDYSAFEDLDPAELKSKFEDAFDPFSQSMILALATGITTADQSGASMKLKRGEIDDTMMREKSQATFTISTTNPSSTRTTRKKFEITAAYKRDYEAWNALSSKAKKETKEPKKPKGFDRAALAVLNGELLARFNANDREDLLAIARFAQEYGFRPVIWGCREGWTVASELGRAGAYAVITPRDRSVKDERVLREGGSSIENAAILHAHGVQVAIRPASTNFSLNGITGRDLLHLPVEAAFGVRGGLTNEAALAAITLIPARILGVDHRIGTLEVGKDLDAIVTDGDVLHYQTFVQWAVVNGKLVYDKEEEVYFAHIRPRPKPLEDELEEDGSDETAQADSDASDAEEGL